MTLTHWELRALIRHQLDVIGLTIVACPQDKNAVRDLQPSVNRLNQIVAAYLDAPKEEVGK